MIKPKRIFIDTSGWVELTLKGEVHHQSVVTYFTQELASGSKFFTNDYVLDESWTRLMTHQSVTSAKALRSKTEAAVKQHQLLILWTDETVFDRAWQAFIKFAEHQLSFTDAVIATVVKDLNIDEILTLDQGFKKIGLVVRPMLN